LRTGRASRKHKGCQQKDDPDVITPSKWGGVIACNKFLHGVAEETVVSVSTGVDVAVGVMVGTIEGVGVSVRVGVIVAVGRGVRVGTGVRVGMSVLVGVALGGRICVGVTRTSLG